MAINSTPADSPASNTGMMFGSSVAAAARDSRMNRCPEHLVAGEDGGHHLQGHQPAELIVYAQ